MTEAKLTEVKTMLEKDCPQNDCRIYLNIFRMYESCKTQSENLTEHCKNIVDREISKLKFELENMIFDNYAIRKYLKEKRQENEK